MQSQLSQKPQRADENGWRERRKEKDIDRARGGERELERRVSKLRRAEGDRDQVKRCCEWGGLEGGRVGSGGRLIEGDECD